MIRIKDNQGLDAALMMDGYTNEQRIKVKQDIRDQFKAAANRVFREILDGCPPEEIVVNMAISDNDELDGEREVRLASYNAVLSRDNNAVFTIREVTVKLLLNNDNVSLFESTVFHEMFHAADRKMLTNSNKVFSEICNKINDNYGRFDKQDEENANIALLKTLQFFNHYRAEGVAILGESLLMKSKFGDITNATKYFCRVFLLTMMGAQTRQIGFRRGTSFDKECFHCAYAVSPIILLFILEKLGDIEHELANKVLDGLSTGNYTLTDVEVNTIMRTALGLTLSEYIQGLTNLGDQIAPIKPFLVFCGLYQHESDGDNINAYEELLQQPTSEVTFNKAMSQIMGSCIPKDELTELYEKFLEDTSLEVLSPHLKKKVTTLYSIMKNDDNSDRKRLAQWALTYFFDEEDVIHDDVSVVGLVDDLTIIDYAINLLG